MKTVVVGSVLLSSTVSMVGLTRPAAASSELDGMWRVTSFAYDGDGAAATRDLGRWRQLTFFGNRAAIRLASDTMLVCQPAQTAPSGGTQAAINYQCKDHRAELRWTRNGDILQIDGSFDGARLKGSARHVVPTDYRLMKAEFRWMID
jgi:hypothetical protein